VLLLLLLGVDTATVYTRKDVAGEELEGEPDLLGYVRLPKDLCVALTQETNGSVFRCAFSLAIALLLTYYSTQRA